jgi:protein phosphatase
MPITLAAAGLTDPGRLREINEDTVFQKTIATPEDDGVGLFIVADGVGGRLAGEVASYWAVETVKNSLADLIDHRDPRATNRFDREMILNLHGQETDGMDPNTLKERVLSAVHLANRVVRNYARQRPDEARGAGSTITMALVHGLRAYVANVGDSRTYLLRKGELHQVTEDHSVVQRLVNSGRLQPDEIYDHPQRNLIYRSLGASDTVKVDYFRLKLMAGDQLLLCTDGLWEMVKDPVKMADIIGAEASLQDACRHLVEAANACGGQDNIGVVLVRVDQ